MNGVQHHLDIAICEDADDATEKGYFYRAPEYSPIEITKLVVVKKGTVEGNATVDFVMQTEDGKKYVCMVTAALFKGALA